MWHQMACCHIFLSAHTRPQLSQDFFPITTQINQQCLASRLSAFSHLAIRCHCSSLLTFCVCGCSSPFLSVLCKITNRDCTSWHAAARISIGGWSTCFLCNLCYKISRLFLYWTWTWYSVFPPLEVPSKYKHVEEEHTYRSSEKGWISISPVYSANVAFIWTPGISILLS